MSPIFTQFGRSFSHKALFTKKMVETQSTTMLNKEIKYNSSPTLTICQLQVCHFPRPEEFPKFHRPTVSLNGG